ncbi:flagellar hook-length control protein FliK [Umezawaea sp. Da 62-37]|uniref:flagellar hook-length control protein FliK n=1 Tax=Umezawaea sp. Da 62-37 TaxID=3075927 RepID=UPI0028F7258F|nr:flagellar hook-length control protein FliK [Umezawaea sp. Da 62-37]WNV88033.1 flagellar hook-length control protein FliK [Umezawaea sp. Da 62-37]
MSGFLRRRAVALCVAVVALSPVPAAVAAPVAAGPITALAGTPGYCPTATGVTVVVDYQELGGTTEVRCAPGAQATGLAALENAGFAVTGTQRWGKAFVCRINGLPTSATEACVNTPPTNAYWSYWHAPNGGSWTYSQQGASGRQPPQGSFEGWSFSLNHGANDNPPPDVAPVRP